MHKVFNAKILSFVVVLLSLVVTAKVISLFVWWYLPANGVDLKEQQNYSMGYKHIDFHNILEQSVEKKPSIQKVATTYSIDNLILKGLYGNAHQGLAVLAEKKAPKITTIVEIGQEYKGYTLKSIELSQVIMSKNNKDYVLRLDGTQKQEYDKRVQKVTVNATDDTVKEVAKSDIDYYRKNPKKVWNDIGLVDYKQNGRLVGFRVTKVKKGSKMAQLGLQKGDIIIRANNVELTSYKNVFSLYNNIDKIDVVDLVILRNNQEMEISYEIR